MKKQLLVCALVFVAGSLLAQNIKKFPFQKRHQNHNENSRTTKTSFLKSGSTVKPLTGKYFGPYDEVSGNYTDSMSFVRTYFPDGNIKSEEYTLLKTGELLFKDEFTYDAKGYEELNRHLVWNDSVYNLAYEYGQTKIYDSQNRLERLTYYDLNSAGDTVYLDEYGFLYNGDSAFVFNYAEGSSAPNQLAEKWILVKENGAPKYTNIEISFWSSDLSAYQSIIYTKVVWNGADDLERLFEVIDYDLFFSSFEGQSTVEGVTQEFRGTGTFSANKSEMLLELKQALIYVPDYHEAFSRDSHDNIILTEYEYNYNPVTQAFDGYSKNKTDNSYNQDNLTKELHWYSNADYPEYGITHEIWYMDFVDVSGIDKTKANLITNIYPNPSNGLVKITSAEYIKAIHFVNSTGGIVQVQATIQGKTAWVDTANLPSGVYLVRSTSQQGSGSAKLLVQH